MNSTAMKALLVGDNPFHNISHLSQKRARNRGNALNSPEYAADLVLISLENGANGFMFSVSETTLSILRKIREKKENLQGLGLYAIVPYAYEYVGLANRLGGVPKLARRFAKEIVMSGSLRAVAAGLKGILRSDPVSVMEAYLAYEVSRIESAVNGKENIKSMILHEIVTDLGLAINQDWLFQSYVDFISKQGITPGFNTCNFAYLVEKLRGWNIDLDKILIAAPFNKAGFQMNPSKEMCEEMLAKASEPVLLAISILAAGYLSPSEAIGYVADLPNLKGVAVGVSKERHARETFGLLREKLCEL